MKKEILLMLLCLWSFMTMGQKKEQELSSHKNTIALLGTYHFDNPNQDQFNVSSDNVLTAKRRKEIEDLCLKLAQFKPTHIALEFNAADTTLDLRYQRYLKGTYTLGAEEREQLGFRIAKSLGHKHIYPVDAPDLRLDFDPGELSNKYGALLEQLGKEGNQIINEINQWLNQYTIGEILSKLNTPELDKLNVDLYYKYILPIGNENNQPGVDAISRWYKRNLQILHNIMKLTEGKQDQRILVIFGQGHTAMLNQFLDYSTVFEKDEIAKHLPASNK